MIQDEPLQGTKSSNSTAKNIFELGRKTWSERVANQIGKGTHPTHFPNNGMKIVTALTEAQAVKN